MLAHNHGETRVINSRRPCSMREKEKGHTQPDVSRPRREWLAPVKGKPSVLLWEQAGEGLDGARQVGTAVMCRLLDQSCRLSTACLGSTFTSVKSVTALWVVRSLLPPLNMEDQ